MNLEDILNLEFLNTKIKDINSSIEETLPSVYFFLNNQKDFIVISINKEKINLSYRVNWFDYYSVQCTDESFEKTFEQFKDKLIESITRAGDEYYLTLNNEIFTQYNIFL